MPAGVSLDRVPIDHGAVMVIVPLLAAGALAATIFRRDRRWWLVTLPAILAGTLTALGTAAWYLHNHIIRDHYPKSFGIWIGEALVAVAAALAGWRRAGRWRRIAAVACVPLTAISAFVLINGQYAYWPTVGDLLGRPLPHEMTAAALAEVLARQADPAATPGTTAPATTSTSAPAFTPPTAGGASDWSGDPATVPGDAGGTAVPDSLSGPGGPAAMPSATAAGADPSETSASPTDAPSAGPGTDSAPSSAPADAGFSATSAAPSGGSTRPAGSHHHPDRGGHRATKAPVSTSTMHGALAPLNIPATHSGFDARPGTLYLPPAFFDSPRPALPVIVMVGGTPGGPGDWPRAGYAAQTADAYASAHNGVAPILAFVDHNGGPFADTECVDGPTGHAETYLATDVPRYLADQLHLSPDPRQWAIAGFSEGGTCAFELSVRHPDVYGAFLDIAGDWAPNQGSEADTLKNIYGGDKEAMAAHDPANLLTPGRFRNLRGWFVVGTADHNHVAVADRLVAAARPAGITETRTFLSGGHNWALASNAFRAVLADVMHDLAGSQST
ncbi:MAG TPA: alpha/beta hydrolase-fold protein [Acidimicrobiia bacterium]